jgi:glycosyltransferase involved in cell wall biosynthesis
MRNCTIRGEALAKVLHVYRTFFPDPPGGLQEAIRQIASCSHNYGTESRVYTLSRNPTPTELDFQGIKVIRARSWAEPASCNLGGLSAFQRFKQAADWADVIHYHFPWPFADLLELLMHPNKPKVMTYHSDIVRQKTLMKLYHPLMQHMLGKMDRIIPTSETYAKTSPILSQIVVKDRIKVIPLGIDEQSYPNTTSQEIIHRLGLKENEPFFLFIGVLRYYKGLHTLIEAASKVQARIVIAGSGPENEHLREQALRCNASNVIFAGQISDSEKSILLQRCLAFVLPSHLRSEAYGMVLVEACMMGKPMISCEIGTGTSYVNQHDETGLVIAPESPEALAQAMCTLTSDKALAEKFGHHARQRYQKLFSGPALGQAYSTLYRDIMTEKQKRS